MASKIVSFVVATTVVRTVTTVASRAFEVVVSRYDSDLHQKYIDTVVGIYEKKVTDFLERNKALRAEKK